MFSKRDERPASVVSTMIALLSACLAFQLNASMLSPALVTIEKELNATAGAVAATQTAFFTAAALFALFLPRLGDIMGRKRVLLIALMLMFAGCVIAALAGSIQVLFVGRVLQGASGPIIPIVLIMLREEVADPKKYGTLLGVIAAVNGGIAGFDAILGGYLVKNFGFHSLFWTMGLVSLGAALLVLAVTRESYAEDRRPLDIVGTVLLVIALGTTLVAVNEMGKLDKANWGLVVLMLVVGVIAFAAFWRVEQTQSAPLVPISQLTERATWSLVFTTALTLGGVFAVMNGLLPAAAQDEELGFGLDAETVSTLVLTPYAVAGLLMGPLSGRLAASNGYRQMLRIGIVGAAAGLIALAVGVRAGLDSKVFLFVIAVWIGVTYAGTANIMLNGLGVVLSPVDRPGSLPGLNTAAFNIGAGLSFVIIYALKAAVPGAASGYAGAIIGGVALLAGALVMSFVIPRPVEAEADPEGARG